MRIVKQGYQILYPTTQEQGLDILKFIERAARICYKSEVGSDVNLGFIRSLIKKGHLAMIEHGNDIIVKFTVDRGISHEQVRHRIASYAQSSTRYCNYSKDKFGKEITVIQPPFHTIAAFDRWFRVMTCCEQGYMEVLDIGELPELARSVLPTSLMTELIVKANPREWRHILRLRTAKSAHPQMRELMIGLKQELGKLVPVLFDEGEPV